MSHRGGPKHASGGGGFWLIILIIAGILLAGLLASGTGSFK
jgi:hypothetical protein